MTRRGFLKVAVVASITTPLIARAGIFERLIVPGIDRVEEVPRLTLADDVRFARAIFTPGNLSGAAQLLRENVCEHLAPGTPYEIRAVPLSRSEMYARARYKRNGYGVIWITGPDAGVDMHYIALGRYRAGDVDVTDRWSWTSYDAPADITYDPRF